MFGPSARHRLAAVAVATLLPLAAVACTASGEDAGSPPATAAATPGGSEPGSGTAPAAPVSQPFGSQCPNLPETGSGSLEDLATQDWVVALASVPALSQLSVITTVAQLRDDLASQQDVTVFAPTSNAFLALGADRTRQLLTNPAQAGALIRYHVVPGRLAPEALPGTHQTLTGGSLVVTGSGEKFTVDDRATVVCGNIQTSNATLYLIDQVLEPS